MDFKTMDIATLTRGISGEGERFLEVFLREYAALFPGPLNPQCSLCLNRYLEHYKNYYIAMENPCRYRLHPEYENIPLEQGSNTLVNNMNITDAYAQKLLSRPNGTRYFARMPEPSDELPEIGLEGEDVFEDNSNAL
jgi:hypothetical protein